MGKRSWIALALALSGCSPSASSAPEDAAPGDAAGRLDAGGGLDLAVGDAAGLDMAILPADMTPPDMALVPVDMVITPADMAVADMAIAPADMAIADMGITPVDMAAADMAAADMADRCAALACDSPPAPVCANDDAQRVFDARGVCVVTDGEASCRYDAVDAPCAADEICVDGACGPPPPPRAGELIITEFMPDPRGALVDRRAQWVEIQNTSARPLPLAGCSVMVDGGAAPLAGVLEPAALLLVGNGDNPDFNGDLAIDAVFDATLSVRGGALAVLCGPADPPALVDAVAFGRFPLWPVRPGFAVALDCDAATHVANDDPANWCLERAVYSDGPEGDANHGTPGAANPSCTQAVDFARHDRPANAVGAPGSELQVFGRLAHPGITDRSPATDRSPLVRAEVGVGPDGSVPDDSWQWLTASGNLLWRAPADRPDLDEYQRFVTLPDRGRYDIAWRFSVDAGRSWVIADSDDAGTTNGYQSASAGDLQVEGVARVRGSGEVVISEFFLGVGMLDSAAQWVELHNPGAEPLDLTGCTIDSPDFQRAPLDGLTIAANGWLAIPRVADPGRNGGIETPVGFGFVLPRAGGNLGLTCRFEIDRVAYDDGVLFDPVAGASLQLSSAQLDATLNDDATTWCAGEAIFDAPAERRGTPGAPNRDCGALSGYPAPQVQAIFDAHCTDCHINGQALGDLSLEPFELNTFGVAAVQLPGMPLVTPGDRQQSYLWHKLSATHFDLPGADGVQMPPGQPFQPGVIERVGLYIDALAPDAMP